MASRLPRLLAIAVVTTLVGVACGSDESDDAFTTDTITTDAVSAATVAPAETDGDGSSGGAAPVGVATNDLGDVLVDRGGFVLYGFTPDEDGTPTCEGACADAWPPVVTESADLPVGLDAAVFTVVERSDGTRQLAAGGWPLYRYAGDIAPGDTTGQGSGGVWFAVAPDGTLIRP
jgi:predicted lipoprotein with Yx(FWY)xxD motif